MTHIQIRALGIVWILSFSVPQGHAADTFVFGFEDLPLMNGLNQIQQESVLFDTPQGRIVPASATGAVTREAVVSFYRETLPQLGWIALDDQTYRREGEVLRLEITNIDRVLMVQFLAEPGGGPSQ